jgi:hypothetical protein
MMIHLVNNQDQQSEDQLQQPMLENDLHLPRENIIIFFFLYKRKERMIFFTKCRGNRANGRLDPFIL